MEASTRDPWRAAKLEADAAPPRAARLEGVLRFDEADAGGDEIVNDIASDSVGERGSGLFLEDGKARVAGGDDIGGGLSRSTLIIVRR